MNDKAEDKRKVSDGFINGFSLKKAISFCVFFLTLFYLSGGFLAQTFYPAVAAGGETCAGAHHP